MTPSAYFIGSIGVVAETSDIQRRAYNQAFREHGVDWHWDVETYKKLLRENGGRERLRRLGETRDGGLDEETVSSIHARKTEIACAEIRETGVPVRLGVQDLIALAKSSGTPLFFVTTTYRVNIEAIADGARPRLDLNDFDEILTTEDVTKTKPDPEVYLTALERLGLDGPSVLAIEDSETSLAAAKAAGCRTLATPGAFTSEQDFSSADWLAPDVEAFLAERAL